MNIIKRLWWSLGRGNPVVPSTWQATLDGGTPLLSLPRVLRRSPAQPEHWQRAPSRFERAG